MAPHLHRFVFPSFIHMDALRLWMLFFFHSFCLFASEFLTRNSAMNLPHSWPSASLQLFFCSCPHEFMSYPPFLFVFVCCIGLLWCLSFLFLPIFWLEPWIIVLVMMRSCRPSLTLYERLWYRLWWWHLIYIDSFSPPSFIWMHYGCGCCSFSILFVCLHLNF